MLDLQGTFHDKWPPILEENPIYSADLYVSVNSEIIRKLCKFLRKASHCGKKILLITEYRLKCINAIRSITGFLWYALF